MKTTDIKLLKHAAGLNKSLLEVGVVCVYIQSEIIRIILRREKEASGGPCSLINSYEYAYPKTIDPMVR